MSGKVCVKCQVELRPKTNGIAAVEMASFGPYKIWMADVWRCPVCGWEGILGFSSEPIAEHHRPHFAAELEKAQDTGGHHVIEFWGSPIEMRGAACTTKCRSES